MEKLTNKQEKFIQLILEGKSQREAYREAYPNSKKWKDKNVDARASRLFNTDKVLARHNELKKELEEEHKAKLLWTRENALNDLVWLKEMARNDMLSKGVRQANSTTFLNTLKELNKLEGLGAERKLKIQKFQNDLGGNETAEDKLKDYFIALSEEVGKSE